MGLHNIAREEEDMAWIETLARFDLDATAGSNRANSQRLCRVVFAWASRLGDGWFWYAMAAALLLVEGLGAVAAVMAMAASGLAGTLIYTLLKRGIRRPRPCAVRDGLILTVAPLDRFSFPSGHTLHATAFSVVATAHAPALGWLVWPFTALVAASRLILGLHYPSDVIAGGVLGAVIAWLAVAVAAALGAPV
jgi:undecaprenyl-diphosphatase